MGKTKKPKKGNDLENLAIMVHWVNNHFKAGHDLSNPKLVTDLHTLLINLHRVLDALGPPASTDQRVAFLVREIVSMRKLMEQLLEECCTDVDGSI